MRSSILKASLAFIVCFAVLAAAGRVLAQSWLSASIGGGGETIALVNIEGIITAGAPAASLMGGATSASSVAICDRLYRAKDDPSVRGVLLRVNSPGGSAVGSDEIYRAIVALKTAGKPVVVSMGDLAASGGYYVSSPASYIYANGATFTGSIGVIFSMLNWEQLGKKLGLSEVTITAGAHKDIGNPWRAMTEDERQLMTAMLSDVHEQFIKAVDEGRQNLNEAQVRTLATGMVFTGQQALGNGLVDAIGGLHEAEIKVRELAKVPADAPVEEYGAPSFFEQLMGVSSSGAMSGALSQLIGEEPLNVLARGLYLNTTLRDLVVR